MIWMSVLRRIVIGAAVAVVFLVVLGTGQALAARPWWHLNTLSAPPQKAGEDGVVIAEATDLGDGCVNECSLASSDPVTLVDKLPAGVTPVSVHLEGDGGPSVGTSNSSLTARCPGRRRPARTPDRS